MNDLIVDAGAPVSFRPVGEPPTSAENHPSRVSLLPDPLPAADGNDPIAALLLLHSRSRTTSTERAVTNVHRIREQRRIEWEKQMAALEKAARAENKGGFWGAVGKVCGTIGKIAAVAASVAVAVGTAGAGAPFVLAVAGACLSAAAFTQGELGVLQKLGVDDVTAGWVELGLGAGGVVCSGAAAFSAGPKSVTSFGRAVKTAEKVVGATGGAAHFANGIAYGLQRDARGDAQDCRTDATRAHHEERRLEQMLVRILADLEDSEESYRQTVHSLQGTKAIEDNTSLIAARSH